MSSAGTLFEPHRQAGFTFRPPPSVIELDLTDPLARWRKSFVLPKDIIYLDGNSLGALPRAVSSAVGLVVEDEWAQDLITSWNRHDWIAAPRRIGDKIARLIGAGPGEVVVSDSTSVNIFKLLVAALQHQPDRANILSEPGNFPTDLYMAQGVISLLPGRKLVTLQVDDLIDAIDEDTAVVMLTHVHYKSGRKLDMAAITRAAHAKGALVLWDLSHSAGAVEVDLNGSYVDLAVGCGYKYLNGGPGAPAFLFVADRLQTLLTSPLTGWMGHSSPFTFVDAYTPKASIDRFLCGTPPILGMAALDAAVDVMLSAPQPNVIAKSQALSTLFIETAENLCEGLGLTLVTPRDVDARGSHVSFAHTNAHEICQALIAEGVVGDFRAPDVVRFGFTPLYTSFADVWLAAHHLADVLKTGRWRDPQFSIRAAVT